LPFLTIIVCLRTGEDFKNALPLEGGGSGWG
jgi:hypothetical protein